MAYFKVINVTDSIAKDASATKKCRSTDLTALWHFPN